MENSFDFTSEKTSSYALFPSDASVAARIKRSVIPLAAETTTAFSSATLETISETRRIISPLPTEVPPNFITTITALLKSL